MASTTGSKIRYVKDRCVNAYWMLRHGKIRLIFKSIYIELAHRKHLIGNWLAGSRPLDDSEVPGSAFNDRRRVLPPSIRPTISQPPLPLSLRTDSAALVDELKRLRAIYHIDDGVKP